MSTLEDYTLEAFVTALAQLESPLEPELKATLTEISTLLTTDTSKAVGQLSQLVQNYPPLTAPYKHAFKQLKNEHKVNERHKLLAVSIDSSPDVSDAEESEVIQILNQILNNPDPVGIAQRQHRLDRAYEHALEVFLDPQIAKNWLQRKNGALGVAPIDLMSSEAEAEKVHTILGRIEYGVYS